MKTRYWMLLLLIIGFSIWFFPIKNYIKYLVAYGCWATVVIYLFRWLKTSVNDDCILYESQGDGDINAVDIDNSERPIVIPMNYNLDDDIAWDEVHP